MTWTQLLCWTLLCAFQAVAGSHPGVTRVLPVEGGLTDFRVGLTAGHPAPPPPQVSQPPAPAHPPPPPHPPPHPAALPPAAVISTLAPAPVQEDVSVPGPGVRFPNNLDVDLGNGHLRGSPYPAWSGSQPGYMTRPSAENLGLGLPTQGMQVSAPGLDNAASESGITDINYRHVGEYVHAEGDNAELTTYRDEHAPSIVIKGPGFNSVAIGFIVYLILLTVLQNSMLNWSQKGGLLTLGPTTQRLQREAVDRASPAPASPQVSGADAPVKRAPLPPTTPASRAREVQADGRARSDPQTDGDADQRRTDQDWERSPVSVAAVLNDDVPPDESPRADGVKPRTVGPRAFSKIMN